MKKIALFTLLLLSSWQLAAQSKFNISGSIVDSASAKPVEFAAVGLWLEDKPVDGTLTDEKGSFAFANKVAGTYKLVISFVGYKPMTVENIQINKDTNLGAIKLTGEAKMLDAITVTGQASLVEDRIDKMVYNADKDISNRGGSAEDVLRKVPMLSVDLDGNLSLRGSENVRVLIDGKPSSIFASSVADALRQIPSDQIKSVEVITSPGAKYDGEGTAGIVNIITKKNSIAGITGNISTGIGYMGSHGFGSLNVRDRKWGVSLQGGGHFSYNIKTTGENLRTSTINGTPTYLSQLDDNSSWRNRGNYALTFDYDFTKTSSLTIGFRNGFGLNRSLGTQETILQNAARDVIREFDRYVDNRRNSNSYNVDASFLKKFAKPDQEFSLLAQWSENNRNENYVADQNSAAYEKSLNRGIDREVTLQADFTQPLSKAVKLEIGGKGILRKVTSDGEFFYYNAEKQVYEPFSARDNYLNYLQDVIAGYSAITVQLPKKAGLQVGTRYEYTLIDADFKEVKNAAIPDYGTWLPNIALTKAFGTANRIKASFNQRIQRPSIRYLNPFVDFSNTNDISYGNPTLRPELVNQYELSYSTFLKANSFNLSLFHRSMDNSITSVKTVERVENQDITRTTFDNIGLNKGYGANLNVQLQPTSQLRIGGGMDVLYLYLDNRTISNKGWNMGYRGNATYSFKNGYTLQAFGFQRSPSVQLQGKQGAFMMYSLSAKKDFKNKKGSIGLGIENPFTKAVVVRSEFADLQNPNFQFTNDNIRNIYRRSIRLDFQYRFGKMEAGSEGLFRRKKGVNNDDLKGDEGGNNEGGGGPGRGN